MKKFEFPVNIPSLYIYVGEEEWHEYLVACSVNNEERKLRQEEIENPPSKGEGRLTNNKMWLSEVEFSLITHEMMHFLDWCFMVMDIPTELEFRAFLASMYNTAVIEWAIEEMEED